MTRDNSNLVRLYLNGTLAAGPTDNSAAQTLGSGNGTIGADWGEAHLSITIAAKSTRWRSGRPCWRGWWLGWRMRRL